MNSTELNRTGSGTPRVGGFTLQQLVLRLPRAFRRHKVVWLLSRCLETNYHRLCFDRSELVGNVREGVVTQALLSRHFEDYGYFDLAQKILRPGDVHFDLGANYGFHTFGIVPLVAENVRHVMIDANPDCHLCHRLSVPFFPKRAISPVHAALTDLPGELALEFSDADTGRGHLLAGSRPSERVVRVAGRRLDEIGDSIGIKTIRMMKIDIEGSEVRCLRGAGDLLGRTDFIYFEVNPSCLELQGASVNELLSVLERAGFLLCWPHQSVDWISRMHGEKISGSDLRSWQLSGSDLEVYQFDRHRPVPNTSQFDLLAVSPEIRVREIGSV